MSQALISDLDPSELDRSRSEGVVLLDVRTPAEFAGGHLAGSWNVPLSDLAASMDEVGRRAADASRVVLVCRTGRRANEARDVLGARGIRNTTVLLGGIEACRSERLEVTGRGVISLERQVRIAAGLLVVVGVALGFLVHPVAFGLSAFVGAGLVFAGITDTCGMGLLLARMPWNRGGGACRSKRCSTE